MTGAIPAALGDLSNLGTLRLRDNDLTGTIPRSLGALSLTSLDLRRNRLIGCIPPGLEGFESSGINPQQGAVNLPLCANVPLSALSVADAAGNELTLSPVPFVPSTRDYTLVVDHTHETVTVTPLTDGGGSITVSVGGAAPQTVGSGTASSPLALVVGDNVIRVAVTPPGEAAQTYTLTVTRLAPCEDGLAVTDPATNSGLVADCKVLLGAGDDLRGTGSLNWDATTDIAGWDGVTVATANGGRRPQCPRAGWRRRRRTRRPGPRRRSRRLPYPVPEGSFRLRPGDVRSVGERDPGRGLSHRRPRSARFGSNPRRERSCRAARPSQIQPPATAISTTTRKTHSVARARMLLRVVCSVRENRAPEQGEK